MNKRTYFKMLVLFLIIMIFIIAVFIFRDYMIAFFENMFLMPSMPERFRDIQNLR